MTDEQLDKLLLDAIKVKEKQHSESKRAEFERKRAEKILQEIKEYEIWIMN